MTESLPPEDPRDALIREQAERLALQDEQIAGHAERIAALEAVVADLREQLAAAVRAGSRNSGNSSMPPSSDDQPGKKPPRPRQRQGGRKRKPGKQPGALGAYLPWNDHPDGAISHFPEGTCGCGTNLAGARDLGVRY